MALTVLPLVCEFVTLIRVYNSFLWCDRNRYDFHDSPNDVEDRRHNDANEQQDERVIKNSLKDRDADKVRRSSVLVTHNAVLGN